MRKRLPFFLGIIILTAALFFIGPAFSGPSVISVYRTAGVKIRPEAAFRAIRDTGDWRKWWPSGTVDKHGTYLFDGIRFGPPVFYYNAVGLDADDGHLKTKTRLLIIPVGMDSILLAWSDSVLASGSRFARWKAKDAAGARGNRLDTILASLQHYLADPINVYGFRIVRETSRDSTLITVSFQTPDSPGTVQVYQKLDGLKNFIAAQHAEIMNFPMMHIDGKPGSYTTMLAYPVNKVLPDSGPYKFKRFLPWKMISAEVRGGEAAIRTGYRSFYQYIQDYSIPVMANGFSFLVTDRSREPDSSKWVTRFSVPIP